MVTRSTTCHRSHHHTQSSLKIICAALLLMQMLLVRPFIFRLHWLTCTFTMQELVCVLCSIHENQNAHTEKHNAGLKRKFAILCTKLYIQAYDGLFLSILSWNKTKMQQQKCLWNEHSLVSCCLYWMDYKLNACTVDVENEKETIFLHALAFIQ